MSRNKRKWSSPLKLDNTLVLKNRVIKAATHAGSSFEEMGRTYERLAKNSVGMITVAYVSVSEKNKTFENQHHIGEDNLKDWKRLVKRVGTKMCAQLHHPGLFSWSPKSTPQGPSMFWLPSKISIPKVMTKKMLQEVREQYRVAAELCRRAGFHCIELHCGHGYLLSQFLTPIINRRSDAFGGNASKRTCTLSVHVVFSQTTLTHTHTHRCGIPKDVPRGMPGIKTSRCGENECRGRISWRSET